MNNVFDLTGKTALITGAGGLLGPKHAAALIEFGARAIITDHHEDRAIEKATELNNKYGKEAAIPFYMDVTNKSSIENVVNRLGKIDILINNAAKDPKVKKEAGLTPSSRFETMTPEYWFEGINAALNGTFFCSQVVANKMLKTGGGVILNIASDLGVIAPDKEFTGKKG